MLKKLILGIFCLLSTFVVTAQNPKDTFKIVLTADSHGAYVPTGGADSMWTAKLKKEFEKYYPTVIFTNLSIGGTQIQGVMPPWYYLTDVRQNIDTVLSYNPDLIIVSQSGNHTVFHNSADSSIYCFKYLIDTLNTLGKRFVITGQAPRQKTFTLGMTLQSYYDSSQKINDFLRSYIPNSFTDPYLTMEDTVFGYRPWPAVLGPDSLHFSDYGERLYYQCNINNITTDSCLSDFNGQAIGFSLTKNSGNIYLSGKFKYRKIFIYGSYNYSTFTLLYTYTSSSAYLENTSKSFADMGYTWYKAIVYSGRKTLTKTVKLN